MYLRNERPSMLHSQILNFALSFSKKNILILVFTVSLCSGNQKIYVMKI